MFNITNKLTLTGNLTILIYTKQQNTRSFMVLCYPSVPVEIWNY
ncbi:hypothetical protein [Spiroplasma poulsonii]|nr:hypothetical protein [Spiroplasma poulsonii]